MYNFLESGVNYMKTFFSRKYCKIYSYDTVVKAQNKNVGNRDKLIIHTANGLYQGTLRLPEELKDYEVQEGDDILTVVKKLYLDTIDATDTNDSIEISENPIAIDLEDVTLFTSMKNINMPFVSIFIDQIIGISIGHIGE